MLWEPRRGTNPQLRGSRELPGGGKTELSSPGTGKGWTKLDKAEGPVCKDTADEAQESTMS